MTYLLFRWKKHTHTKIQVSYIYHESNRGLAERKRTIQVSGDTEKNKRGGELIKTKCDNTYT